MGLETFKDGWSFRYDEHSAYYRNSSFDPPAPEYSVGEVLVGAAYRGLNLGIHENRVELDAAEDLPIKLAEKSKLSEEEWRQVLLDVDRGLGSPPFRKQPAKLTPISPFVPEIGRYSCVLGTADRRWNPYNLLTSAIGSGASKNAPEEVLYDLFQALRVDEEDDLLARFIETRLGRLSDREEPEVNDIWPPANRLTEGTTLTPAERFVEDVKSLIELKSSQTRKQWVVLLEALFRVGLPLHFMWMCRLNYKLWTIAGDVLSGRAADVPDVATLEDECWEGHHEDQPLLELGADARPFVEKWIRRYLVARIGVSVILHSMDSADVDIPNGMLRSGSDSESLTASEKLFLFLEILSENRNEINSTVAKQYEGDSVVSLANRLADSKPAYLSCDKGPGDNAQEFLRYSMGQLRPKEEELRAYDQSYLTFKRGDSPNSPWIVSPGPAMLLVMVHGSCRSGDLEHQSVDGFKKYLSHYGLETPSGELSSGKTGQKLEELGIAVDSPDAGGGRLLHDPL